MVPGGLATVITTAITRSTTGTCTATITTGRVPRRGARAGSGMTMIVVTHEMGFARQVADRIVFFDEGVIVEQNAPAEFFANPREERTKTFLSQILSH